MGEMSEGIRIDMLRLIFSLPEQLLKGYQMGKEASFLSRRRFENVAIIGMGGSAIGGDIVRTIILQESSLPILVWRDYQIPPIINNKTLGFFVSYSGNTEETLCAYKEAKKRGSEVVAITSGGILAQEADKDGFLTIEVPKGMPPRSAIGFLTMPILGVLNKLRLSRSYEEDVVEASKILSKKMEVWRRRAVNISQRLYNMLPFVYSTSRLLDVVAYRWRCQLNENAKVLCHTGELPEQRHNEIMGFGAPDFVTRRIILIALVDQMTHPRNLFGMKLMLSLIKEDLGGTIWIKSEGVSPLSRIFSTIVVGDLVSVALAKRRKVDPVSIPRIDKLKEALR